MKFKIKESELENKIEVNEAEEHQLDNLLGLFKSRFKTINDVKNDKIFKGLSDADQEYIIDELKSEGWK